MAVKHIDADSDLGLQRGSFAICLMVDRMSAEFARIVRAVLEHAPADSPVLVCDQTPSDSRVSDSLSDLDDTGHRLRYLRLDRGRIDRTSELAAPADVVLLSADCLVASGSFEGLHGAAYCDSTVATATAMTLVRAPGFESADQAVPDFESAAEAVRIRSLRLRPRIAAANGPCVYVRRSALELVGPLEPLTAAGDGTATDFWHRCVQTGLSHVLADDVLVSGRGGQSVPAAVADVGVLSRVPVDDTGPLARALSCARRARSGLSVVLDAGILSGPMTGTQVHVLETIAALARTGEVHLRAIVPVDLSDDVARSLEAWPGVELMTYAEARKSRGRRADLVHRPFQVNNAGELRFLSGLAERVVITHQDLISYFNPSYFPSLEAWEGYRQLTRGVLAVADRVLFFSEHARSDALGEELVEPTRAGVVHIGVDHGLAQRPSEPLRPSGASHLTDDAELILCVGSDYHHKNRLFALRVLEQLQRRHGWTGYMLFAGPAVSQGSSRAEEAEMLGADPRLAGSVLDCSAVSEAEKAWLYRRARLVIYPTVREGFGLVPFEAADHDVPCMWAPGTSLSELLPDAAATILPWNAGVTADRTVELLHDDEPRELNIATIRAAGGQFTWDRTAARLLAQYVATCDAPATPASGPERRQGRISEALSEDALRLVGPGGALPQDLERPLLALATHPRVVAPIFRALKLGYRTSYKLRRWGRGAESRDGADIEPAHRPR